MPLLSCRNITRRPWFEAFDLDVEPGEVIAISGPVGSGKSLFLRALADLDPVDSGEVRLGEVDRTSLPASDWRRRVLYVHPGGVRLPGTVQDNLDRIASLGAHAGRGPITCRDLPPTADAERLSSGERQLLALERALAMEPDVLLLDEPTSSLDPKSARKAEARILDFASAGRGVLWISHDATLVERLGVREVRWKGQRAS